MVGRSIALIAAIGLVPVARAQEVAENPLVEVAGDMRVVVSQLHKLTTGKPTQQKQGEIIQKLDALIAELEKECEACRGGASGARPNRPLADSSIIGGPGGMGDLHAPRTNGKKWGELPAKERDRILQSMSEGFPSHYQSVLERYFRRLGEEKPSGSDSAGVGVSKPAAAVPTNTPANRSAARPEVPPPNGAAAPMPHPAGGSR